MGKVNVLLQLRILHLSVLHCLGFFDRDIALVHQLRIRSFFNIFGAVSPEFRRILGDAQEKIVDWSALHRLGANDLFWESATAVILRRATDECIPGMRRRVMVSARRCRAWWCLDEVPCQEHNKGGYILRGTTYLVTAEWDHGWRKYHVCCFGVSGLLGEKKNGKRRRIGFITLTFREASPSLPEMLRRASAMDQTNYASSILSNRIYIADVENIADVPAAFLTLVYLAECSPNVVRYSALYRRWFLATKHRLKMSMHELTFFLIRNVNCFCILGLHDKTLLFMIYYDTLHKLLHCFVAIYICAVFIYLC